MIKYLLLNLLMIGLFVTGKSQTGKFEYGLQSGLNINSVSGSSVSKDVKGVLTGLSLGGHLKWSNTGRFGLKMLLSYDENGWAYRSLTFENSTGTGLVKADVLYKLRYLNLPVLVEYSLGNKVQVNIDAGVFMGVLLNNKVVTNYKDPLPPGQPSGISTSSTGYHRLNYGVSVGFGMQVPIASKIKLDFDIRNHTGLYNIFKPVNSNRSKIQTNCLALLIGFSLDM